MFSILWCLCDCADTFMVQPTLAGIRYVNVVPICIHQNHIGNVQCLFIDILLVPCHNIRVLVYFLQALRACVYSTTLGQSL